MHVSRESRVETSNLAVHKIGKIMWPIGEIGRLLFGGMPVYNKQEMDRDIHVDCCMRGAG